jgi:hypothetical protein
MEKNEENKSPFQNMKNNFSGRQSKHQILPIININLRQIENGKFIQAESGDETYNSYSQSNHFLYNDTKH